MCENTSDFSGVKVGDKLWSVQLGECEVVKIDSDLTIKCRNIDRDMDLWYRFDGTSYDITGDGAHQQLFWSRPEIIAPPKPKRKVVKTVEAWISIHPGGMKMFHWNEPVDGRLNRIACVHLTGTYEVEE